MIYLLLQISINTMSRLCLGFSGALPLNRGQGLLDLSKNLCRMQ